MIEVKYYHCFCISLIDKINYAQFGILGTFGSFNIPTFIPIQSEPTIIIFDKALSEPSWQ